MTMAACAHAGGAIVQVIEYYNSSQDHYFVSSLAADIQELDSGKFQGWKRTGRLFEAYDVPTARILDDAGQLRRFVNVYVGDEDVRFSGGLEAPVPEGAKVSIIPAVAGG